jgi:hypothetical protein
MTGAFREGLEPGARVRYKRLPWVTGLSIDVFARQSGVVEFSQHTDISDER